MTDEAQIPPRRFDLSRYTKQIKEELPPPGRHIGKIANVDYSDNSDTVWLFIDWEIEGFEATVRQIMAIAADGIDLDNLNFNEKRRLALGLAQLANIQSAAKIDLESKIKTYGDFAELIGTKAELILGHRKAYGVPEAVIKTVLG